MHLWLFLSPPYMFQRCKVNHKSVFITAVTALLLYGLTVSGRSAFHSSSHFLQALTFSAADTTPIKPINKPAIQTRQVSPTQQNRMLIDTVPIKRDSTGLVDSLQRKDSLVQKIDTFDFKISKDSIDAPVDFE